MWTHDDILEIAFAALAREEARLKREQAAHGIDRHDELILHAIFAEGFKTAGLGVFREICYPSDYSPGMKQSDRLRCDLVLTRDPAQTLADPTDARRLAAASRGTLFETATPAPASLPAAPGADNHCPCDEAFWLEIKLVGQFAFSRGVPVPNATYSSELVRGLRADLDKLQREPLVRWGAAMLVALNLDRETAEHDLDVVATRLRAAELAMGPMLRRGFPITDRIGNRWCSVALTPVR